MRIAVVVLASWLTFTAAPAWANAQEVTPVIGARQIWSGSQATVRVRDLAIRVAPILWFSAEEPLFREKRGSLPPYRGPIQLPCDTETSEPVVYYRASPAEDHLSIDRPDLTIEYFFFYPQDYGGGCHSNDLESVVMQLRMEDRGVGTTPRYIVALRLVSGQAHGSLFFSNDLDLTRPGTDDTSVPIALLVEEGKHAVAPDRNADGQYTPGYDINRAMNDAWGVRDIFGSSQLGPSEYQASMTKIRHGRFRLLAKTDPPETAATLWGQSYRSVWWPELPTATYELREIPAACRTYRDPPPDPQPHPGCDPYTVTYFLDQKGIATRDRSVAQRVKDFFKDWHLSWEPSRPRNEVRGRIGVGTAFPFYEVPLIGGSLNRRSTFSFIEWLRGENAPRISEITSADFQVFYTPSLSRRFEWYAGGGGGFDLDSKVPPEGEKNRAGLKAVAEFGVQFRWQPHLLIGVGAKVDTRQPWRLVVEIGRAEIGFRP